MYFDFLVFMFNFHFYAKKSYNKNLQLYKFATG